MQYQGGNGFTYVPEKWRDSAVLTERWRLLGGNQLFYIQTDPSQSHNVADQHPDMVTKLRARYEAWWADVSPRMKPVRIHLGNPAQPSVELTSVDWYMPVGNPPSKPGKPTEVTAQIMISVEQAGNYRVTLSEFPLVAKKPMSATHASLRIGELNVGSSIEPDVQSVTFDVHLPEGDMAIESLLTFPGGQKGGAYFTSVEKLD